MRIVIRYLGVVASQYWLAMSSVLLAHTGHWALWVLYAVPVVIVLAATGKALWDQRREKREPETGGSTD